jgi:hypothetical protein
MVQVLRDDLGVSEDGKERIPLKAGASVLVRDLRDLKLLGVSPGDNNHSFWVALETTNLEAQLTTLYDQWMAKQVAPQDARGAWVGFGSYLQELRMRKFFDSAGRPKRNRDGSYPLLLESIAAGEVTEIHLERIKKWGEPKEEVTNQKRYWTVQVTYECLTTFGSDVSTVRAWIFGSRVEKWLYFGSEEVVP